GQPAWGTWYFALGDVVAKHPPGKELVYPEKSLEQLRGLMAVPRPDREKVQAQTAAAAKALDAWLPALHDARMRDTLPGLARELDGARDRLGDFGWDGAAQLYLALAAQAQ